MSSGLKFESIYILPLQNIYAFIVPYNENVEREINSTFSFKSLKASIGQYEGFELHIYYPYSSDTIFNRANWILVGEDENERLKLYCFKDKRRNKLIYEVKKKGCLVVHDKSYKLFLNDLDFWLYFLGIATIIYYQFNKGSIALHSGMFSYGNTTSLMVGKNESGKTTFLLNLSFVNPNVKYLCDDICLLLFKNDNFYCRPIMNGDKNQIKNKRLKKFIEGINYRRLIYDKRKDYKIDNIIFLEISGKRETVISNISKAEAFVRLLQASILLGALPKDKFVRFMEKFLKLISQVNCYLLKLGTDLKQPSTAYNRVLNLLRERKEI